MTTTSMPMTSTQVRSKRGGSHTLKNYWVDIALFLAFIIDMNTQFTGIPIHEWLGIGFGIALVYHMLLHWAWIVNTLRRIVGKLSAIQRIRALVDILLFVDMVILVVTGLWISEVAMGQLGLGILPGFAWRQLHFLTANLSIWLVALHLALSWSWIADTTKRYLVRPLRRQDTPINLAVTEATQDTTNKSTLIGGVQ